MAIYPVINDTTGETKELDMPISEYDAWKEANPEWRRDWSQGCGGAAQEGEWKHKLVNKHPGWKRVLDAAARVPKNNLRDLY